MTIKNKETRDALKDLKGFTASTLVVTLLRFVLRLLKSIVFVRLLGPYGRGAFGLLTTVPELVVSFGNLGFGLGNTYLIAKKGRDTKAVLGNTLLFTVVLGIVMVAVGYGVLNYQGLMKGDSIDLVRYAPWVLFVTPFVLLDKFGTDLLVATKEIHYMNLMRFIFSGLPIALVIGLWYITGSALGSAVFAWSATFIIVGVLAMLRLMKINDYRLGLSMGSFKEAISYGSRGYVGIFANRMVRRIDYLFISAMIGAEALGFYIVGVALAEILLAMQDSVSRPFLPLHLGLEKDRADEFAPIVIRHVLFISALMCIFTAVFGKPIIRILYGAEFMNSYTSLLWLLPGVVALCVYGILKADMYRHDLPGFVSWVAVLTLVANLVLNYLFIPVYGIAGAAMSSSISYGLATAILFVKYIRLSGNSPLDSLVIKGSDLARMKNKIFSLGKG